MEDVCVCEDIREECVSKNNVLLHRMFCDLRTEADVRSVSDNRLDRIELALTHSSYTPHFDCVRAFYLWKVACSKVQDCDDDMTVDLRNLCLLAYHRLQL